MYTHDINFFEGNNVFDLAAQYGTPFYLYNENILRQRCKEIKNLVEYPNFVPHYSIKANTNIHLLKIVHEEGLHADVMSPGEIFMALQSGFSPEQLFFIPNNVTAEDMQYAIDHNVLISVDSLNQLELYGKLNPNSKVAIRFNPGVGAGHHEKVVTAGKKTKFGVNPEDVDVVKSILNKYNLTLVGINQHIGSLFMDAQPFIDSTYNLLDVAMAFDTLEFIDLGGGYGIPYHKEEGEARLDLKAVGEKLDELIQTFIERYGRAIQFQIEPGRYISCECGIVVGRVTDLKENAGTKYMGTDIGFNVLARPIMYDAHHDMEIYSKEGNIDNKDTFTVVGNICESGDILAKNRVLPTPQIGDLIGVLDAGAYGFCMSTPYNQRFRCAEVLLTSTGAPMLIRRRETFEDLIATMNI